MRSRCKRPERAQILFGTLLPLCLLGLVFDRALAAEWDAANDFSPTSNPAGAWSYGWSVVPGGSLTLYGEPIPYAPCPPSSVTGWHRLGGPETPNVYHNGAATVACGCCVWQANDLTIHPGPGGEYSVLRWTAPATDIYRIQATFAGRDSDGASTDVHVLHNSTHLFSGTVTGMGVPVDFVCDGLAVSAGEVVDFVVGRGGDCSHLNDTTAIDATILSGATLGTCNAVPPPPPCVPPACSDGVDNDGDGCTDYPSDLGCTSPSDDTEEGAGCPGPPAACSDGADNDGDGCADYPRDLGCTSPSDDTEDGAGCAPVVLPPVPSVSDGGIVVLSLLLLATGFLWLARRKRARS